MGFKSEIHKKSSNVHWGERGNEKNGTSITRIELDSASLVTIIEF